MSRAMFDYTKAVLNKVSFDVSLFCTELKKALTRLLPHEIVELKIWVYGLLEQKPQLNQCLIYLNS
jgi:hypothetical protein